MNITKLLIFNLDINLIEHPDIPEQYLTPVNFDIADGLAWNEVSQT